MSTATESRVISHATGDRHVSRFDLANIATPRATSTWYPVPHVTVADTTVQTLREAGYTVRSERWTLSKADQRLFGVVDLALPLARWDSPGRGATVSLGIRSSFDKRLPLGIVAGSKVFVCSNLAFAGDISYKRKHTRFGLDDFRNQVESAIERLPQYQALESQRIDSWMKFELSVTQRDALILALIDTGVIGIRSIRAVLNELKQPTYEDFDGKPTIWSTFNVVTTAMRQRVNERIIEYSTQTSRLIQAMDEIVDVEFRSSMDELVKPLALEFSGT